jgi:sugar-specific transcriptional regulator TrmB
MVVNTIIPSLMDTGLSEYEARAYMGLLGKHPATAYEVARASGIPTSKIYEVVRRLEEKGIVSASGEEKKRKYIPIEPSEFVESRRSMMQSTLEVIEGGLRDAAKASDVSYIWNLSEYDYFMDKAERIIERARECILVSIYGEEMRALERHLREAEGRHIKIAAVHFGIPETLVGSIYRHPIHDTIYAEKGGRGMVVVGDSKEALIGTIKKDGGVEGAYSPNAGFVTLAEDYIKHDIYVMKMIRRFDSEFVRAFGSRYEKLRDVYDDDADV